MEQLDERDLNIYTDGSSFQGPRRGGVGIRFVTVDENGNERIEDYPLPGFPGASNQQMELAAPIEALKLIVLRQVLDIDRFRHVVIWTDSMYLVNGYDSALFTWQSNGWMTREGNPVAHAKLWKELLKLAFRTGKRVEFKWVKGHKKSSHNKAVDKLAKGSARDQRNRPLSIVKVRRKHTSKAVEVGSVQMEGQRATIRIITDEYLAPQKMNKYKYEVISRASPYRGHVDLIYSSADIYLSAGHTYYIRFNDDTKQPRVVKVFREVAH